MVPQTLPLQASCTGTWPSIWLVGRLTPASRGPRHCGMASCNASAHAGGPARPLCPPPSPHALALQVDYYGAPTPLKTLASIGIPDASTLLISPFDKGSIKDIEKVGGGAAWRGAGSGCC